MDESASACLCACEDMSSPLRRQASEHVRKTPEGPGFRTSPSRACGSTTRGGGTQIEYCSRLRIRVGCALYLLFNAECYFLLRVDNGGEWATSRTPKCIQNYCYGQGLSLGTSTLMFAKLRGPTRQQGLTHATDFRIGVPPANPCGLQSSQWRARMSEVMLPCLAGAFGTFEMLNSALIAGSRGYRYLGWDNPMQGRVLEYARARFQEIPGTTPLAQGTHRA